MTFPGKRLFLLILLALCAACQPGTPAGPTGTPLSPGVTAPLETRATPSPSPTASPRPSLTPSPSPTLTPSITPTPPHPLNIEYLRQQEYPGSEFVIEETLANGANYYQYIVSYPSEGLKLRALLTVPFGETPPTGWPAIVFNHGYIPPDIYRTTERYVAYVAGFATNGYIVLRPDYRGHDQSEGEARGAYGEPDYTIDVLNGLAAIRQYPAADPVRIGMWGHSMGGYITLRAMVVAADIKAGVIWAGVVGPYPNLFNRDDFVLDSTPSSSFPGRGQWRLDLLEEFGTPEENSEPWAALSANNFLGDLSGPIQLHHGTADTDVPSSVSELLYDQLTAAGLPAEFYGYPGDDHNLSIAFSLAMQRSIQFFDRYMKGAIP